jgi:hypothetical protein
VELEFGELNKHELWGANLGNSFLEVGTKEQVFIIISPEFGTLEGNTLLIDMDVDGLQSSGICLYQRFKGFKRSTFQPM